jgi:predicted nucleotidyltransferase component of viral defense system
MLTRAQIQRIAQRHGIGLQAQERDYIQHLLLFSLFSRSQSLIFKGGTALRVVYGGNRYSEDLDFNGPSQANEVQTIWEPVTAALLDFGIIAQFRNDWLSESAFSFDVSYQGPLYDGRDRSKGKVRVDVNMRQEVVESARQLVSPEYDDLRPFVVTVLTREDLLAEKVRALFVRGKPRDAYDIWLMSHQGVQIDPQRIDNKLALYGLSFTKKKLIEVLDQARPAWERDLHPLVPQFVAWDDVKEQILSALT